MAESLAAAEKLAADGVNAKVINIHTIKPLDEELVVAAARECGRVVTVEEHLSLIHILSRWQRLLILWESYMHLLEM